MKRFRTVRFLILALAVSFALSSLFVAYAAARTVRMGRLTRESRIKIAERLAFLESAGEVYFRTTNIEPLRAAMISFASETDLSILFASDVDGKIIASTNIQDVGELVAIRYPRVHAKFLEDPVASGPRILPDAGTDFVVGYAGMCAPGRNGLRGGRCGFVYYELDLAYRIRETNRELRTQMTVTAIGLLAGAFALWLVLTMRVTRRTETISTGIKKFASGNRSVRLRLEGADEIAELGRDVDDLFARVNETEIALKDRESRLREVFDSLLDGLIIIDTRGIIQSINPAGSTIFGYRDGELAGQNISVLMPEPHHSMHDVYLANYVATGVKNVIGMAREAEACRKDGTKFPIDLKVSELRAEGQLLFIGIIRDISERRQMQQDLIAANQELEHAVTQLAQAATTDSLTGLYNRRSLDVRIEEEIRRAQRHGQPVTLLVCDVDHFKMFNDHYGHQAGDDCLIAISNILQSHFRRGGEFTARYGGEEFVVILPDLTLSEGVERAEHLRRAISSAGIPHAQSPTADHVTISIGVAVHHPDIHGEPRISARELFKNADDMLYRAKQAGRNQIQHAPVQAGGN